VSETDISGDPTGEVVSSLASCVEPVPFRPLFTRGLPLPMSFYFAAGRKKPNSASECKLDAFSCASERQSLCKQLFFGFMVTEKSAEITWQWCDARKNMFNLGICLRVENR
jgi:hypothetical protein